MNTVAVRDINIKGYILSVTTRYQAGDTIEQMNELTFRTIEAWLFIADLLERGIYEIKAEGSIESRYETSKGVKLIEHFNDSRVTVWDTFRGQKIPHFHLNSDDDTQQAINVWAAQNEAIHRIMAKHAIDASESNVEAPPQSADSSQVSSQAAPPPAHVAGVLPATRAPSPNTPQYADGQLVSYKVNRIVASSNNGSATYQLWGELGQKYPLVTVYKLKPDGNEKPDYLKIKPVISSLNLSLDKTEAAGNWLLVCRAAHSKGKEYMNVEQLEAVTA